MAQDVSALNGVLRMISPRYGEIRAPTIILAGGRDRSDPPQRHAIPLHRAIAGSRLIVFEHAGHMLPHSCGDAVLGAIGWVLGRPTVDSASRCETQAPGR